MKAKRGAGVRCDLVAGSGRVVEVSCSEQEFSRSCVALPQPLDVGRSAMVVGGQHLAADQRQTQIHDEYKTKANCSYAAAATAEPTCTGVLAVTI